jgi:fatty-acyl-CoA synthase
MPAALSYSSGESATPLLGDTIGGNFDATVRAFGDREALVDRSAGRRWTYAELAADVDALALGLLEMGIAKGDRSAFGRRTAPNGRSPSTRPRRSARSW